MEYSKSVKVWLFIGLVMVFIQVVVGGITRLTESGLSITKWEVVSGTLPPMSEDAWLKEFELYKNTPQYKEINEGMSMEDFKFIFFWEYIHRFWARIMGFVFLFPFLYFLQKKMLDKALLKKLGVVIFLAVLAATFGWIMVASGLVERPWVNAYKLSLHLLIAFSVYVALLWAFLSTHTFNMYGFKPSWDLKKIIYGFIVLLILQIFFGGVLSGMKAAVVYPSWPDMNGVYFPSMIFDKSEWTVENFNKYDRNVFVPTLIHFLHRNTAYILFIVGIILCMGLYKAVKFCKSSIIRSIPASLLLVLILQVTFGIVTVLKSVGNIPVLWGVLHQVGALLLLTTIVFSLFIVRIKK